MNPAVAIYTWCGISLRNRSIFTWDTTRCSAKVHSAVTQSDGNQRQRRCWDQPEWYVKTKNISLLLAKVAEELQIKRLQPVLAVARS